MGFVIEDGLVGWRGAVLLLVALVGAYLMATLLRLARLGRKRQGTGAPPPVAPTLRDPDALIDLSDRIPPGFFEPGMVAPEPARSSEAAALEARFAALGATGWAAGEEPAAPRRASADESRDETADDFARSLQHSSIEAELQQLRRESAALREEVMHLREELGSIKAARNVSPLYSEAMAMAQSGASADGIAGQCGISLAEAQLLAALARGETEDDALSTGEEINDGYPITGSRTGTNG
jgi:hypothetical protein